MSSAVAGSLVVTAVVVALANAAVVAVGWANKRRQPRPGDRPYLVNTHGPATYATVACIMAFVGAVVVAGAFE